MILRNTRPKNVPDQTLLFAFVYNTICIRSIKSFQKSAKRKIEFKFENVKIPSCVGLQNQFSDSLLRTTSGYLVMNVLTLHIAKIVIRRKKNFWSHIPTLISLERLFDINSFIFMRKTSVDIIEIRIS